MRNLTLEEFLILSLEMKVAYYIQGWNTNVNPTTVEEWANEFGGLHNREECPPGFEMNGKKLLLHEHERLYNFITQFILIEGK